MILLETLSDGSQRISAGNCAFLFSRIAPGVLYSCIAGVDSGELGTAPLDYLQAECTRFRRPLVWFADAREAPNVVSAVFQQYTAWLDQHRHMFSAVHVLTDQKPMLLTLSIARHLSGTQRLMTVHEDKRSFDKALAQFGEHRLLTTWREAVPITILKRCLADGAIEIRNPSCCFTFRRASADVILSSVTGVDSGSLANAPFDHLQSELDLHRKPLSWFTDLTGCTGVVNAVPESWLVWIAAHQDLLTQVGLLMPPGALPLMVNSMIYRLNAQSKISVYHAREPFINAVRNRCPQAELQFQS